MKLQEIKEKWKGFGQFLMISGHITNSRKINKQALLTLRPQILKYTCNLPKHLISQISEYSETVPFTIKISCFILNMHLKSTPG